MRDTPSYSRPYGRAVEFGRDYGHGPELAMANGPYSPKATAFFAALSVQPDADLKLNYDTFFRTLDAASLWSKMDWFTISGTHDEQAARVNMANPAQVAVAINSPTFQANYGWIGDAATSCLNTNWNPLTAPSPKFTQDDAHMGVWINNDVTSFSKMDLGNYARSSIVARNVANLSTYPNAGSAVAEISPQTSVGYSVWSKNTPTGVRLYKNGVSLGDKTVTSALPFNQPFMVMAGYTAPGVLQGYSDRHNRAFHWGSKLTDAEVDIIYDALVAFTAAL